MTSAKESRSPSVSTKAALILGGILLTEGSWVGFNLAPDPGRFLFLLGFAPGQWGTISGWCLAAVVTAAFVHRSRQLPSVRATLLTPSPLKALALPMALAAGILEEAIYRRMLMNYLQHHALGVALQILVSASLFGLGHGIWGLFGRSMGAAVGATLNTAVLGFALAVVYVVSNRSVAACVVSHAVIDMLIEPGLVLAALRGEMSSARAASAPSRPPG